MPITTIKWHKEYCEDLGTKGQDGFYDYAYCYFIYSFYLPSNDRIVVRNYTDTILEGNIYVYRKNVLDKKREVGMELVSAVLAFMYTEQNIIHFKLFDGEYKPIDLSELEYDSNNFTFIEVVAQK